MIRVLTTVLLIAPLAAVPAAAADPFFTEENAAAGISVNHGGVYQITGQAWGDFDGDACLDLYLTDSLGLNSLYRSRCDGTFELSEHSDTVALQGVASGGTLFADYDNDGWADLYVLAQGANTLFRNDGGQGFVDVTTEAGVGETGEGETAAWGDYDGDGWLDLYVVNWYYEDDPTDPRKYDVLYRSNGPGAGGAVTFTDVTATVLDVERTGGPGFAASWVDFDNDGDLDLYVVNDKEFGNVLWRNDGDGCGGWCMSDVSVASGAERPAYSMGLAVGDYDLDLDLDFYFSSHGESVLLQSQVSQGSPTFIEVSDAAGVNYPAIAWGTVFADFDNDGWLDIYLATLDSKLEYTNALFRNMGDGTFDDVSLSCGASDPGDTYGVAAGDYDRDGRIDLVIGNLDDRYVLYKNRTEDVGGWLKVLLEGGAGVNRDAIGARVTLELSDGRTLLQELKSGSSLGAGNELALHFGTGAADVESATVRWPDGLVDEYVEVPRDTLWEVQISRIFADGFESGDFSAWSLP